MFKHTFLVVDVDLYGCYLIFYWRAVAIEIWAAHHHQSADTNTHTYSDLFATFRRRRRRRHVILLDKWQQPQWTNDTSNFGEVFVSKIDSIEAEWFSGWAIAAVGHNWHLITNLHLRPICIQSQRKSIKYILFIALSHLRITRNVQHSKRMWNTEAPRHQGIDRINGETTKINVPND